MRKGVSKALVLGALVVFPATALGSTTTWTDPGMDGVAPIALKITNGGDKRLKSVVVSKLPYSGPGCDGGGRTGKIKINGSWRVKDNGFFRVVGQYPGSGPGSLDSGQLNLNGRVKRNHVYGEVKFTYGKSGCQTQKLEFDAHR